MNRMGTKLSNKTGDVSYEEITNDPNLKKLQKNTGVSTFSLRIAKMACLKAAAAFLSGKSDKQEDDVINLAERMLTFACQDVS